MSEDGMPSDLPDHHRMTGAELLEEFATAALKSVVSDTNRQERAWEQRLIEMRHAILDRMGEV